MSKWFRINSYRASLQVLILKGFRFQSSRLFFLIGVRSKQMIGPSWNIKRLPVMPRENRSKDRCVGGYITHFLIAVAAAILLGGGAHYWCLSGRALFAIVLITIFPILRRDRTTFAGIQIDPIEEIGGEEFRFIWLWVQERELPLTWNHPY